MAMNVLLMIIGIHTVWELLSLDNDVPTVYEEYSCKLIQAKSQTPQQTFDLIFACIFSNTHFWKPGFYYVSCD